MTAIVYATARVAALCAILGTPLVFAQGNGPTGAAASQPAASCARGQLEAPLCDANGDLVADVPLRTVNPDRLVLGISSVEDAMTATKTYGPLQQYLASCLKKEVQIHPPVGESQVLEGMRNGQVHLAQFPTGITMYAVNFAGAVPFAGKGLSSVGKPDSYSLMLLVRADSAYRKPADLAGKRVAHVALTSNSGNFAPRALLPAAGLTPDTDYKVEYSGKHDKSIMGVALGMYDGAAVASDVFERLIQKGEIKRNQFRVLYESEGFPPNAFTHAHNLEPRLVEQVKRCFMDFRFPDVMVRLLENNDRFFPISYQADWRLVRQIASASGTARDRAAYDRIVHTRK